MHLGYRKKVGLAIMSIRRIMVAMNLDRNKPESLIMRLLAQPMFWLLLSLGVSVWFSILAMDQAFESAYVVQDDARQHVFWMQRFLDPGLFPGDLIADYFQSVAPLGYTTLYRVAAACGLDPMFFNKILPFFLGVVTTALCFRFAMKLFPLPISAFVSTVLLNQSLWAKDDLVSATPRAFVYPLMLMFLLFLSEGNLWLCALAILLQGLFYPQLLLVSAIILLIRLFDWKKPFPRLSADAKNRKAALVGLVLVCLVLLPFVINASQFGPVISAEMARQWPEFSETGRTRYFLDNPFSYWISGERSGLIPKDWFNWPSLYFLFMMLIGSSLPILMRFRQHLPLLNRVDSSIRILSQLAVASITMFAAAHLFLFKFHLPSRYTQHSIRILMAITAAIVLTSLVQAVVRRWFGNNRPVSRAVRFGLPAILIALMLAYPMLDDDFPSTRYYQGKHPALYAFFKQQPHSTRIASLTDEANNLPSFTGRSIVVGSEYAIPYHLGYAVPFREKTMALVGALYNPSLAELKQYLTENGIDFLLLDKDMFKAGYLSGHPWLRQYQTLLVGEVDRQMRHGLQPALAKLTSRCTVLKDDGLVVIQVSCLFEH